MTHSLQSPRTVAIADAIVGVETVLLATPGAAVLAEHGQALDGHVVIDATNDISGERRLRRHYVEPRTRCPLRPRVSARSASRCSPTHRSVARSRTWPQDAGIEQLIANVGLRPVRVGETDAIDVLDGVARLWLTLVFRQSDPRRRSAC